ncbi:MAG: DUF2231 domain-containing protein [Firmicutes bacterium]|nr:DUF2231 domain-containing protein [Alicyclobacillaceae bacterium]MCL6497183.1 DUF2231 domain-containing protein [Bacillota bacterium]
MVGLWARLGARFLPPTIHPMVVHFPIALLYLATLIDFVAVVRPRHRSHAYHQFGFWILTLALVSLVAAALAGVVSEQFAHWTPATRAILEAHQRDALITGLLASLGWVLQLATPFREVRREAWSIAGRGRVSWGVWVLVAAATAMVSVTGTLGGSMVYHHGVGISAVSRGALPAAGGGKAGR